MNLPRRCCLALIFMYCLATADAQVSRRLTDNWEFIRQDLGSPWEAVRPVATGGAESVPFWTRVTLPHCVNATDAVDPDLNYYQGPSWYRTRLNIDNPYPEGRTVLHFEGAGQKTKIYLDTMLVGSHVGGYDEFTIDLTDAIAVFRRSSAAPRFKGAIPIAIRTDNSRDVEMIPSSLSDFTIYGGIYRYLNLVYIPAVSIEKIQVSASTDATGKAGRVIVDPRFYDPAGKGKGEFSFRIIDPSGKEVMKQTRQVNFDGSDNNIDINLKNISRWSPADPQLYRIEASIGEHHVVEKFGFRHMQFVKHGPFLLNGSRLLLQGTHRHEDQAGVGAAMTEDMMRTEMILIKDMGVNFIRLGHYQQSRIILDLCDSLGILVWEEIPWCRGGLGGPLYKEQARRMLTNMIHQHYNHPSIIIWGLGNENDWPGDFAVFDTLAIRNFMKELNSLAHKLDDSRKTAIRRCEFCKDIVDVYSPSIWAGWYRGIYTEYKSVSEAEMKKVDHFLHVEWGGDSHAGRHSENPDRGLQMVSKAGKADERTGDASLYGGAARVSKDGDWSESYMCNLVDWHLKEQLTMPWLTGSAQWPFKDFATPLRPDNPVPYVNQKGVVERDLTKKETYYVYQSYWSQKPMAHIYGHSWPTRWGKPGELKMIKVYSNCDNAELFVNGRSLGSKKRDSQDFPATGLRWEVPLDKGIYKVSVVARKGSQVIRDSIAFKYETAQWGPAKTVRLVTLRQSAGIATVEATLLDAAGITCLDSSSLIRFGLAGEGTLIDDLGTSSGSRYVELCNGRSVISLHINNGRSVVSAKVNALPVAMLEIRSDVADAVGDMSVLYQGILKNAANAMNQTPVTVTATHSARSAGGLHDYYSEGDYWWPDPRSADSPHIQRDGMSNPDNFNDHRIALIRLSELTASLVSAFIITGDVKYKQQALAHYKAWFIDTSTRMNPNLLYAQAIRGRATGRGIGIIDAIQLMEVVKGVERLERGQGSARADASPDEQLIYDGVRAWFASYLQWVTTHPYGIDEMNAKNNHGTCWVMQVGVFAKFTGNDSLVSVCIDRYKNVLLPRQMGVDGSFPLELRRTKPYGYSLFNLDAMSTICRELSGPGEDLWNYATADGRSIREAIAFMYPYIIDKTAWPYARDVMYWNNWPVAQPALLFGGQAFKQRDWIETWRSLDHFPLVDEVIRNLPVRNPLLW